MKPTGKKQIFGCGYLCERKMKTGVNLVIHFSTVLNLTMVYFLKRRNSNYQHITRFAKNLSGLLAMCVFWIVFTGSGSWAQQDKLGLAEEYYRREDFAKSVEYYDQLAENRDMLARIYPHYSDALIKLNQKQKLEKLYKKIVKAYPFQPTYQLDQAFYFENQKDDKQAAKVYKKVMDLCLQNRNQANQAASYAIKNGRLDFAEQLYINLRKQNPNPYEFLMELCEVLKLKGKPENVINELLIILQGDGNQLPLIQNLLQNTLTKKEHYQVLEKKSLSLVQQNPANTSVSELLVWLYLQQKDFGSAFIQAKAIDKRERLEGQKLFEIGNLAAQNQDLDNALLVFDYLVQQYDKRPIAYMASRSQVNIGEKILKSKYPVPKAEVRNLIRDYLVLNQANPNNRMMVAENLKSIALLHGGFLNQPDSGIYFLEKVIDMRPPDVHFVSQCKLYLGDYYIVKGEPWEATLIYSQVEKDEKDHILGHEAKLRNARLSYFKAEFELAKEHLDVLKLATSREIANDAMQLSLLIQDNTAFDTAGTALRAYAKADLFMFLNRDQDALHILDSLLELPKNNLFNDIEDDVHYLKQKLYVKARQFDKALNALAIIREKYAEEIYGDDAWFLTAKLYEENLKNSEKAMEFYAQLLEKFPGSIYAAESRKRYRQLRGDILN